MKKWAGEVRGDPNSKPADVTHGSELDIQKKRLIQVRSVKANRIQKILEDTNINCSNGISDVLGKSGLPCARSLANGSHGLTGQVPDLSGHCRPPLRRLAEETADSRRDRLQYSHRRAPHFKDLGYRLRGYRYQLFRRVRLGCGHSVRDPPPRGIESVGYRRTVNDIAN